jgi:hypothetical protein
LRRAWEGHVGVVDDVGACGAEESSSCPANVKRLRPMGTGAEFVVPARVPSPSKSTELRGG